VNVKKINEIGEAAKENESEDELEKLKMPMKPDGLF
jgi:hypothetical protein